MKLKYIIGLSACVLAFIGCTKSFLEQEPHTGLYSKEQLEKASKWNQEVGLGLLRAVNLPLYKGMSIEGYSKQHDNAGLMPMGLGLDIMTGNVILTNNSYKWYEKYSNLSVTNSTTFINRTLWTLFYKIIFDCNSFLSGQFHYKEDGIPTTFASDQNMFDFAQVKTERAFAYLQLLNLYTGAYEGAKDTSILPLYTTLNFEGNRPLGQTKTSDIYEFAIKDLQEAISIFTGPKKGLYNRESKLSVDGNVASIMLAKAYITTGQNEEASKLLETIIPTLTILPKAQLTQTGFYDIAPDYILWGNDTNPDTTEYLAMFMNHVDLFSYSYAYAGDEKKINYALFESIANEHKGDLRKGWFDISSLDQKMQEKLLTADYKKTLEKLEYAPIGKFFSPAGKKAFEAQGKLGTDKNFLSDPIFMRSEEALLLAAEAYARANNDAKAQEVLITLLKERTADDAISDMETRINGLSGQALLDEIYYNYQVELWGEGRSLEVIRRFKKSIVRSSNSISLPNETISWDNKDLIFKIPQIETSNNPNIF